jgi:hypothetical protein
MKMSYREQIWDPHCQVCPSSLQRIKQGYLVAFIFYPRYILLQKLRIIIGFNL